MHWADWIIKGFHFEFCRGQSYAEQLKTCLYKTRPVARASLWLSSKKTGKASSQGWYGVSGDCVLEQWPTGVGKWEGLRLHQVTVPLEHCSLTTDSHFRRWKREVTGIMEAKPTSFCPSA